MSILSYAVPIRRLIDEAGFPTDFITASDGPLAPVLDRLFFTNYALINRLDGTGLLIQLVIAGEAAIGFPGLDGLAVVFGRTDAGATLIDASFFVGSKGFSARLDDVVVGLRFPPSILKPVPESPNAIAPPYAQIEVSGAISLDENFDLRFEGFDAFSLKPVMIGNTGIIISAEDVKLDFSRTTTLPEIAAAGFDESFMGVYIGEATIKLPDGLPALAPEDLVLRNCVIGSGGVGGKLEAHYDPHYDQTTKTFTGSGAGTLFGIPFGLKDIALEFKQNSFQKSEIKGELLLPFFEEPVQVDIGIGLDGGFSVKLTSAGSNGLFKLTKENILELELDSIGFEVSDGVFTAKISGQLTPLIGKAQGLKWPSFKVNELSIDSEGHVRLDGGWLNLPDQYSLDFHGFKIEITQLGFGKTEDGGKEGKWIGFSGGLKLVDGFSAGASVEGLRTIWYADGTTRITLNGVGVEFKVPEVVRFKGEVSYREFPVTTPTGGTELVHRFDGDIELNLISLDLEIDATLVIGSATGDQGTYTFFAIYVNVELPTGIPLAATGTALYGFAGLFALQMEPDKHADEEWYEGWFKRPDMGVIDLDSKWVNRRDSLAFGAGVTLGTLSDRGFTIAGRLLLVIVFPGPIWLFEGKANLLKERAKLDGGDEPTFRALAVVDNREKNLLIGLDAFYRNDEKDGRLLNIRAGAEAFFDFKDASAWRIDVGKREPREKRIRAEIFKLFEANAYLMLDAHQLAVGAWLGYSKGYKFGPLKVSLEAWIEGNAVVSWKPIYFHGDLSLYGSVEISAFGFGLGLTVDARFAADVFDPFHVVGELSVGIKVPLRKKPLEADLKFEWGPRLGRPLLPLPLKEIAIEHFKVTTTWPLLLLPNYDPNGDGFLETPAANNLETDPPPSSLSIVPPDCRPHISFGRTVHDSALIGVNAQPVVPPRERIGDPAKNEGPISIRYSLDEIALSKWNDPGWQLVASKSINENPTGVRAIFGSWAPVPSLPAGNVTAGTDPPVSNSKLWLWSLTPFDYTRHSGNAFNDWFAANFTQYPCIPKLSEREICCDFERIDQTQQIRSPLKCVDHPEISIEWSTRGFASVTILKQPIRGLTHALCLPRILFDTIEADTGDAARINSSAIRLSEPAGKVAIVVTQEHVTSATVIRFRDFQPGPSLPGFGPNPLNQKGVQFEVRDVNGRPLPQWRIGFPVTLRGTIAGLNCEGELEIILPCASSFAQLTLTRPAMLRLAPLEAIPVAESPVISPPNPVVASITIQAFDEDGSAGDVISLQAPAPDRVPETIRITGRAIKRIVIRTPQARSTKDSESPVISPKDGEADDPIEHKEEDPDPIEHKEEAVDPIEHNGTFLHELWFDCSGASSILATAFDDQGNAYGPFPAKDHFIEVVGTNIKLIRLQSNGEICILQVCATIPPNPAEVEARNKMAQNLVDEMARWSESAEVLEPHTTYRLKVVTSLDTTGAFAENKQQVEYAYFRTGGPPGLTKLTPIGPVKSEELDSGLNDLVRYVRQTTPATVPATGDNPVMAKPVYRAYDVGVEFNERYVDLMYRMDGRDLGLYLYDNNNSPAHDVEGRLIIANNAWGTTEEVTLTESEVFWITLINERHCDPPLSIVANSIPRNKTLTSAGEGQVLDGDTLYEARLVPLLLHETFTDYAVGANATALGSLGQWAVVDAGSNNGPSRWEVREEGTPPGRYIIQISGISGGSSDPADPVKPGAVLVRANRRELAADSPDQPSNWMDYRLSAYLRSATDGAIGLVFRYLDADHYYRFSMDRQGHYRRVVSVVNTVHTILGEDAFVYDQNRDYLITVEAIGSSLRVYQDGALVFDVNDASIEHGSAGLYCRGNTGARFSDVRIDDFRKQAPAVYSFKFTTSLFTDFFHHVHSFQDETWIVELGSLAGVQSLVAQAVLPATSPSEAESRAYDALAELILGPSARQNPPRMEVTRVEHDGEALALLVRSPEPINWLRADLEILHTPRGTAKPKPPVALKLTDVTFGVTQPNEESVTLLLREATNLTGYRIEYLNPPGVAEPIGDDQPVLFRDRFAADDTTGWTIVDEGTDQGPSSWSTFEGAFRQTSNINTPEPRQVLRKKGTQAVAGDPAWTDFVVSTRLRSLDSGAIGLLFRYKDTDNYYRLSMDSQQAYRRLVKNGGGTFTLLWEDDFAYEVGREYQVTIVAIGGLLRGYLDGALMFDIDDTDLAAGRVGLYCFRNTDARFSEVRIAAPVWTPYYTFGKESRMPAGTRVRVYAGNEADAPAEEQGVVRRFIASGADHGQLRLPADGADLRLRAPDGAEEHARRFLPDADYLFVAAIQVLRKADGTGFFVIVPSVTQASSALAPGQYRLRMTYRRNNQAIDPGSQLLSEAGNKSDERATIDIPW